MKHVIAAALGTLVIFLTITVQAQVTTHPSTIRPLIHADVRITDEIDLDAHVIPTFNLMEPLNPYIFIGPNFKSLKGMFEISPLLGWNFGLDEPVFAVAFTLNVTDKFWTWADVEVQAPSWSGYYFVQLEYQFLPYIGVGAETEGFGAYNDTDSWSHGGGPNLIFNIGDHLGIDLALHVRDLEHQVGLQFVSRVHLTL